MAFIDDLKQVNGMQDVINIIETIQDMEDSLFTEETYEPIMNSLKDAFDEQNRNDAIVAVTKAWKSDKLTIEEAIGQKHIIKSLLANIIDNVEMSEYKKKVLRGTFDSIEEIISLAVNNYFTQDIKIYFELTNKNAKIPTYAHDTDAGADIYCPEDITIPAYAKGYIIHTGFKMAIPRGWEAQIRPRSGMSVKTPLRISNAPGTIDAGYRDEVGIIVDNISNKPLSIASGDRIAQMVIAPVYNFIGEQVSDISEIGENRGGGFGSTGK